MSWSTRFRLRQYLTGSLWVVPLVGGVLGALLGGLAALTGFVVTVTVLVVQMATGTFSARYMRLWYRERMLKALLAFLVGTLAFSFALLRRVESKYVPNLGVSIAASATPRSSPGRRTSIGGCSTRTASSPQRSCTARSPGRFRRSTSKA